MTGPEKGDTHLEMTAEERQPDEVVKRAGSGWKARRRSYRTCWKDFHRLAAGASWQAPHSTN